MLWLLNIVLVGIPIGTTAGVLVGLQAQRDANGQEPLFGDLPGYGGGGAGSAPKDDRITNEIFCDTSIGFSPPSQHDHYTFNPNPWNWKPEDKGGLCLNVTRFHNETYPTEHSAPEWSVTWAYPLTNDKKPVHAFPNVMLANQVLPVRISDVSGIEVDFEWTYSVGNDTTSEGATTAELAEVEMSANVALDLFIDADKDKSQDTAAASAEIMIWFAELGTDSWPVGKTQGVPALNTTTLANVDFELYSGQNDLGQKVHSWVAKEPAEKFHGDIFELVKLLLENDNPAYPNADDYIGTLQLGTEAYRTKSATSFVTFHVPQLAIDVELN